MQRVSPQALALLTTLVLASGCRTATPARPTSTTGSISAAAYEPARALGPLFQAVQLSAVFSDSKTFVDARPLAPPAKILAEYETRQRTPGFDLTHFVQQYFQAPSATT